jgi:hypothetical protein
VKEPNEDIAAGAQAANGPEATLSIKEKGPVAVVGGWLDSEGPTADQAGRFVTRDAGSKGGTGCKGGLGARAQSGGGEYATCAKQKSGSEKKRRVKEEKERNKLYQIKKRNKAELFLQKQQITGTKEAGRISLAAGCSAAAIAGHRRARKGYVRGGKGQSQGAGRTGISSAVLQSAAAGAGVRTGKQGSKEAGASGRGAQLYSGAQVYELIAESSAMLRQSVEGGPKGLCVGIHCPICAKEVRGKAEGRATPLNEEENGSKLVLPEPGQDVYALLAKSLLKFSSVSGAVSEEKLHKQCGEGRCPLCFGKRAKESQRRRAERQRQKEAVQKDKSRRRMLARVLRKEKARRRLRGTLLVTLGQLRARGRDREALKLIFVIEAVPDGDGVQDAQQRKRARRAARKHIGSPDSVDADAKKRRKLGFLDDTQEGKFEAIPIRMVRMLPVQYMYCLARA